MSVKSVSNKKGALICVIRIVSVENVNDKNGVLISVIRRDLLLS